MLAIEGGDAETREARLTLAPADDARYEAASSASRGTRIPGGRPLLPLR